MARSQVVLTNVGIQRRVDRRNSRHDATKYHLLSCMKLVVKMFIRTYSVHSI